MYGHLRRVACLCAVLVLVACGKEPDGVGSSRAAQGLAPEAVIHVDDDAPPGGDGSGSAPYDNLPEAIVQANALGGGAIVKVAPGVYPIASTLVIEESTELRGSTVMEIDSSGLPTGVIVPGTETRIEATQSGMTLVRIARSDGGVLHDVTIQGFSLLGMDSGSGVQVHRVQGLTLRDNYVTGLTFGFGFNTAASSGRISGNYITGVGCGTCIAAGYEQSPANVEFVGNRSVHNNFGGVLLNGTDTELPERGDRLVALIQGNDLSDNSAFPLFSFGIRIFAVGPDLGFPSRDSTGHVTARIQGNRLHGNAIGMSIDAGFTFRFGGDGCDPYSYTGNFDLSLRGNRLSNSLTTPGLISFTRSTVTTGADVLSSWKYLAGATYTIDDPEEVLANAWIDNPESDPFSGACNGGQLDNTLRYNGQVIPSTGP